MASISGSVGRNGVNRPNDVRTIQQLLNQHASGPRPPLAVDGMIGPKTIGAIEQFQRQVVRMYNVDGRVDPGGKTLQTLNGGAGVGPSPVPTPPGGGLTGKPLMERVKAFTDYVQKTYKIAVGINSSTREPLWQQRMHVAHMIKYNSYKSLKPKQSKLIGGHWLIDFEHLKDPKVIWGGGLNPDEFLRDSQNRPCTKTADGKGWNNTPDETKTRARALELLKTNGVATAKDRPSEAHSAMVACGVQGCAEPCGCGGNRSNHLAGQAVDLNRQALDTLRLKLSPPTDAELDKLLAQFGLHRPMDSEPWHVESKN